MVNLQQEKTSVLKQVDETKLRFYACFPKFLSVLSNSQRIPRFLIIAIISYYFWFLYLHAVNIPKGDDITDVLQVISAIEQSGSASEILAQLFGQHNDHRTFSSRLIYWGTYGLTGEINFRTLTFLANLGMLMLFIMLCHSVEKSKGRWWVMLTAAVLLFQLRVYALTLWPMAAFAYFYVFVYGFASLYCLHRTSPLKFVAALIFASLGTYTLASGQVEWLVGLASLLHQLLILKRIPFGYVFAWLLTAVLVLLAWRTGLDTPNTVAEMLRLLFLTPLHHSKYFLAQLGSAVSETSVLFASFTGATMLALLLWFTTRRRRSDDLRLEFICWFIVLSIGTMTLGRAPYTNLEYALSSRYSFPSVILLTSFWVLIGNRWVIGRSQWLLIATLIAGTYCMTSYQVYSPSLQPLIEKRVKRFNHYNYWIFGSPTKKTNAIVAEAVEQTRSAPGPAKIVDARHIHSLTCNF
jgi:hypothetical protein